MIKIGDKVKVTGTGGIYIKYQKMADLMGSKLFKKNLYPEIMEFEVIEKRKHHCMDDMVYLLKNYEGEFLFTDKDSYIEVIAKPRTKTEFVKVGCEWNAWEYIKAFSDLPDSEQWFIKVSDDQYAPIHDWFNVAETIRKHNLIYRKVETEIDERQEFIDAVVGGKGIDGCWLNGVFVPSDVVGVIFDSGKVELVE